MKNCIEKIGFDIQLVEKELQRIHDNSLEVDYLVNFESVVWNVIDEVGNVIIAMENHNKKHPVKKDFNKPTKSKVIDTKVFNFINGRAKKVKDKLSEKFLNCISYLTLNKNFIEADKVLEHWINELGEFSDYLSDEIESRQSTLKQRVERNIKKFYWNESEETLIDMFEQFKSKGFWEYEGDTKNAIAIHFNIDKREVIPIKSELPIQKINWLFKMNDLVKWYRVMIDKKYIVKDTSIKHKILASHFLLNGKQIDSKIFGDRYRQVKSNPDYKIHSTLNTFLEDLPEIN